MGENARTYEVSLILHLTDSAVEQLEASLPENESIEERLADFIAEHWCGRHAKGGEIDLAYIKELARG